MKKKNKFINLPVIIGIIIFVGIAFVVISSGSTVKAVVPNQQINAGTRVDKSMLKVIDIPSKTPGDFITDVKSLVGQKVKMTVEEDQLLYVNNVMSAWDDFSEGNDIPEDYIVTSMQIPANHAVGGLITIGDIVDVLGVPKSSYHSSSQDTMDNYLGEIAEDSYGADGVNLYWILANVKILETDSTLSQSNESSISGVVGEETSGGNYYIVALSYEDYEKLRLAEVYLDLWLNISPEQNAENGPLLDAMKNAVPKAIQDAQAQSKMVPKDKAKPKPESGDSTPDSEAPEGETPDAENPDNTSGDPVPDGDE